MPLAPTPGHRGRRRADAGADRGPVLHAELAAAPLDRRRRHAGHAPHAERPRADDGRAGRSPRALIDFWQCDARGVYDNEGYRFRGHQLTDAKGRYTLFTVVPGLYTGRTKHIHVKVQAPGEPVLTTQLFFPGVAGNASDGIFDTECLIRGWRLDQGPPGRAVRLRARPLTRELTVSSQGFLKRSAF